MIIYRIFNKINGKSYIGQSVVSFNKRFKKNNLDTPSKNYWQTNKQN